jgi:hypothetical protein
MKKFKNRNFYISMTIEYVTEKYLNDISECIFQYNSYKKNIKEKESLNIFYNIYLYYHKNYSDEFHLIELDPPKQNFTSTETYNFMKNILKNQNFLDLLENILNSKVMRETYKEINKLGKSNIETIKDDKRNINYDI